jgi:NAD-dependent dihydropyrimidine dehydrogenase PreA subunit
MTEKLDRGRLEISADECKGCGLCIVACPVQVIEFSKTVINKQGYHPAQYKGSGCTGCGNCFFACPEPGAVTVYRLAKQAK